MNKRFLTIISLIGFIACQHKPLENSMPTPMSKIEIDYNTKPLNCNDCKEVDTPQVVAITQIEYFESNPKIRAWALNPSNNDEFLYTQIVREPLPMNTFVWNWKTKKRTLIQKGVLCGLPRWHANDWILLSLPGRLFKKKPDGSDSTHLGTYEANTGATWNHAGDQIAFYRARENDGLIIADAKSGHLMDTIIGEPAFHYFFDWTKNNVFARQRGDGGIIGYHLRDRTRKQLCPATGSPDGFCWLSDFKNMAVATSGGLFLMNTETGQSKKIKCSCSSVNYRLPNYSPQYNKLFVLKTVSHAINPPFNTNISVTAQIVMMNLDGSDEQIIDLPQ